MRTFIIRCVEGHSFRRQQKQLARTYETSRNQAGAYLTTRPIKERNKTHVRTTRRGGWCSRGGANVLFALLLSPLTAHTVRDGALSLPLGGQNTNIPALYTSRPCRPTRTRETTLILHPLPAAIVSSRLLHQKNSFLLHPPGSSPPLTHQGAAI